MEQHDNSIGFYLITSLIASFILQLICFIIAYPCQFDKITDLTGSLTYILIALFTLLWAGQCTLRSIVVTIFVCLWAIRLGTFLLVRVMKRGRDSRFDKIRINFWRFFRFFMIQMLWVWIVCLPLIFINTSSKQPSLTGWDYAGWILWILGYSIEVIADTSKYLFNTTRKGVTFMSDGLWSVSRHPNYFGEIIMWIGIFLSSIPVIVNESKWEWLGVLSPLIVLFLLLFVSGINLAEDKSDQQFATDPQYIQYKKQTSPLIPFPPQLYGRCPGLVKRVFFFERERYSVVIKEKNPGFTTDYGAV